LLFERGEFLIAREQQLFEEQSQSAQYIQNVQAHLERVKTEWEKSKQPLALLSQQLQEEEYQSKAASSCLIEAKAVIGNDNLNIQNKMSQIAKLFSHVEQKSEAKIPMPLSSDNPAVIERPAIPVPEAFLFIVNAALYVPKDQIKHMIFMMPALKAISDEAKRAHEQVRNKTFFSWRGYGWTAETDRSEINREFSAFNQAMISLTPTQEPMILRANQCLRALMTAILKAPDLGDLHLYHFPLLQNFIRCVTENLFERLESMCDNVERLERIKNEDADKMKQLDQVCMDVHFRWVPQKKRKELESNIAAVQEAAVRPKKYLKQLTSIFRVRKLTSEDKTIQAMSNLVKEYFAPKS